MADKKISELSLTSSIDAQDASILVRNNVDLQYTFATLLQFISNNISTGANFSFGTTLPSNLIGKNGDIFVNTSTGSFAQKMSGTWTVAFTMTSAANSSSNAILYGLGVPAASTGNNGDTYIAIGNGVFYQKSSGAWSQVFSMQNGPAGATGTKGADGTNGINGKSILHGNINPSNDLGTDGDFYLDTTTCQFFGPKTSGIWPPGFSIIGEGLISGGTTGQFLIKASNNDYDTEWETIDVSFAGLSGLPNDNGSLASALNAKQNVLVFDASPLMGSSNSVNSGALWTYIGAQIASALSTVDGELSGKVDKVSGKNLISDSEISRLAGVADLYDGTYTSFDALQAAFPTSTTGHTAIVDPGSGTNAMLYIWDAQEGWVQGGGSGASNFADLGGSPSDNAALASAFNAKQNALPAVSSGEKIVTLQSDGVHDDYDLVEQIISPSDLTGADFSRGTATVTGIEGQVAYDAGYRYDCVASNTWVRTVINNAAVDLYLSEIDDTAKAKTSTDLQTAYADSVIGQQVWGINYIYIKKTDTGWKKISIADA